MPSLRGPLALLVALGAASWGCHKRATAESCDALVRHFAELTARENGVDGGAEIARVVAAAKTDPDALACTDEVDEAKVRCGLAATTTEAVITCLER